MTTTFVALGAAMLVVRYLWILLVQRRYIEDLADVVPDQSSATPPALASDPSPPRDPHGRRAVVRREAAATDTPPKTTTPKRARAGTRHQPAKLGFNEQRELEQAPARIEALQAEQSELDALYTRW